MSYNIKYIILKGGYVMKYKYIVTMSDLKHIDKLSEVGEIIHRAKFNNLVVFESDCVVDVIKKIEGVKSARESRIFSLY
jgi:hypothetical protein